MNPRILCVDDEARVVDAQRRQLHRDYDVHTATSGAEALAKLSELGPYAVMISDYNMPEMDGVELLKRARRQSPDTTRIMLTGRGDLTVASQAVNEGNVFRFLTKPCERDVLVATVQAGVRQHQLVTAERDLLQRTLSGAVKVLTDVLAIASPGAFGKATRIYRIARTIASSLEPEQSWEIAIAAMLSQIGCIAVPPDVLEKALAGGQLDALEQSLIDAHPVTGADLIRKIPRLEGVAKAIALQNVRFDGEGVPQDWPKGEDIPFGARILHVAADYDALRSAGEGQVEALSALQRQVGEYDPEVLEALASSLDSEQAYHARRALLDELRPGMILAAPVKAGSGVLVIAKGHEITESVIAVLRNFVRRGEVAEPFDVLVQSDDYQAL